MKAVCRPLLYTGQTGWFAVNTLKAGINEISLTLFITKDKPCSASMQSECSSQANIQDLIVFLQEVTKLK